MNNHSCQAKKFIVLQSIFSYAHNFQFNLMELFWSICLVKKPESSYHASDHLPKAIIQCTLEYTEFIRIFCYRIH